MCPCWQEQNDLFKLYGGSRWIYVNALQRFEPRWSLIRSAWKYCSTFLLYIWVYVEWFMVENIWLCLYSLQCACCLPLLSDSYYEKIVSSTKAEWKKYIKRNLRHCFLEVYILSSKYLNYFQTRTNPNKFAYFKELYDKSIQKYSED